MEKPQFPIDWDKFNELIKERRRQREKELDEWAAEQRKPQWLISPKETSAPLPTTIIPSPAEEQVVPESALDEEEPDDEREVGCPAEPIHNCELDIASGDYYCPYGCGAIADDPWEAMFHEVSHFAEPGEVEAMRRQHQADVAAHSEESESRHNHEPRKLGLGRRQKIALAVGVLFLVSAGLFPPWRSVLRGPYGISSSRYLGHAFSPPATEDWSGRPSSGQVDLRWLGLEWVIISVVTGAAVVLLRNPDR